jgi:maltose-binding protein MalE
MRTYDERIKAIQAKAKRRKAIHGILKTATGLACMLALIIGIMHIPYGSLQAGMSPTNPFTGLDTNVPADGTGTNLPPHSTRPTQWHTDPSDPTDPYYTEVEHGTLPPEPEVTVQLNIWAPDDQTAWMVNYHVNSFNAAGGIRGVRILPNIMVVAPDQVGIMLQEEPPENQPHLICTDQTAVQYLARLDMLIPFLNEDADEIAGKNDKLSVDAASYGPNIYATPLYHRDGYFLYYDSSVISPGDVGSLEYLISACEAARKNFCFDLNNPYYQASFFLGAGWYSYWYQDVQGDFTSYRDNLNSEVGMIGMQGMAKLLNSPCYITPGNTNVSVDDAYRQAAVIVAGPWEYERIKAFMGEHMETAKLPTFKVESATYQLGSFANTVMVAVPNNEDMELAHIATRLALFLGHEANQVDYWCEWGYIPTNISAQQDLRGTGDVDPFLAQSHYAEPMETYPQAWWEFFRELPSELTAMSFAEILERYVEKMDAVVEQPNWEQNEALASLVKLVGDVDSWYNKALSCEYASPEQLDLGVFFLNAFREESNLVTDSERAQLKNLYGSDLIDILDITRLPVERMNAVLQEYFGITLEDIDEAGFKDLHYLESTNCYYIIGGGASGIMDFKALSVETLHDGSICVYYTANWDDAVYAFTLTATDNGYRIASNRKME